MGILYGFVVVLGRHQPRHHGNRSGKAYNIPANQISWVTLREGFAYVPRDQYTTVTYSVPGSLWQQRARRLTGRVGDNSP